MKSSRVYLERVKLREGKSNLSFGCYSNRHVKDAQANFPLDADAWEERVKKDPLASVDTQEFQAIRATMAPSGERASREKKVRAQKSTK